MGTFGKGKGKMSLKQVQRLLKMNGYSLERINNHFIYKKGNDTFILPRNCHDLLLRRMFKEHEIKTEEELKRGARND